MTGVLTGEWFRRSTGNDMKKHRTLTKFMGAGWGGYIGTLPCYHPSGLSFRLIFLFLSLNLAVSSTYLEHGMFTQ